MYFSQEVSDASTKISNLIYYLHRWKINTHTHMQSAEEKLWKYYNTQIYRPLGYEQNIPNLSHHKIFKSFDAYFNIMCDENDCSSAIKNTLRSIRASFLFSKYFFGFLFL